MVKLFKIISSKINLSPLFSQVMIKYLFLIFFLLFSSMKAFANNIDELIDLLRNGDNLARIEASERIMRLGTSIDKQLLKLLKKETNEVKRSIAWILGEWGEKKYSAHLIPFLDDNHDLSKTVILALGKIGDPQSLPHLVKKLKSKSRYIRTNIVLALGMIGDKNSIPHITSLKNDQDWHVREAVAIALGKIGSTLIAKDLEEMVNHDPDVLVRMAAEEALESLDF